MESVRHDHHTSLPRPKKDRRSTFSYGPARPPLNPYSDSMARILPQRIITPGSTTTGVESIWFQSIIEHPYFGVSLADIVDDGVEKPMIAPEERVFLRVGLKCEEIQFSILVSAVPGCQFIHSSALYSGQVMGTHPGLLLFPSTFLKGGTVRVDPSPEDRLPRRWPSISGLS